MSVALYWKVATNAIREAKMFRVNFVFSMLIEIVPLVGFLSVVETVYSHGSAIGSYSKAQAISYYVCSRFMSDMVMPVEWWSIVGSIRSDGLGFYLTKPYSFFWYQMSSFIASKLCYYMFAVVGLIPILLLWGGSMYWPSPLNACFALFCFVLSMLIAFQLTYLVSISAFWLGETPFISGLMFWLLPILLGTVFPLDAFPRVISLILKNTPFRYLLFFPTEIFMGRKTFVEVQYGIVVDLFFIVFLSIVIMFAWKRGVKRYNAAC